jgi:uncharacterized protein (TIGR03086 family)
MTEIADRYRRLAAHFADVIDAVPPDRWSSPSPCEEWTALELVQHVVDSQSMFLGLVGRDPAGGPAVADDPGAAWRATAAVIQVDLEDPERATQTFTGFAGESTFEAAVDRFINMDLVVHAWDLARATGGDERIAAEDVERVQASLAGFGEMLHSPGVCGPAVPVSADADAQTKLLAELGRTA